MPKVVGAVRDKRAILGGGRGHAPQGLAEPAAGGISETEILLAYGGVHFASKMGQLAGNHFITVTGGLENLYALGRLTLMKGAQDIRFETA